MVLTFIRCLNSLWLRRGTIVDPCCPQVRLYPHTISSSMLNCVCSSSELICLAPVIFMQGILGVNGETLRLTINVHLAHKGLEIPWKSCESPSRNKRLS